MAVRRRKVATNKPSSPRAAVAPVIVALAGHADDSGTFRVINERVRLAVLSALAVSPKLSFAELKALLNVTDGNLSMHVRKLEDAGFVLCEKSFLGRKPLTEYTLTRVGRAAFNRYIDHMEALIVHMRQQTP